MKQFLTLARDAFDDTRYALTCLLLGHRWTERLPHRYLELNDFDCTRCGAYREQ